MRVDQVRLGARVVVCQRYRRKTGFTPPGRCGIITKISRTKGKRVRYQLAIQTNTGEISRRIDQVKLATPPVLLPSARRTIWIRTDVAGRRGHRAAVNLKLFYWKEPPEGIRHFYKPFDIHLSRVSGLSMREDLLRAAGKEQDELWTEIRDHLHFLKEEGAMPVDMAPPNCTISGQKKEEQNDGDGPVEREDRSAMG